MVYTSQIIATSRTEPENVISKPAILIKNLNVYHQQAHILKDINLAIPNKGITTFLGPSGCGKTTLLKSLNRLTDLYNGMQVSGSILVNDQDVLKTKHLAELRQKMGLLSQRPFPLPMSIFDNVAFGLKIRGIKNKTELSDRVAHHLQQVALWDEVKDRLKSPASRLSIGQQQRLCLARGLAVDPEVILADEPTSALDPISSSKIEEQFEELKKTYPIILVTHMLRQARRLSDHVVFLYYGQVIEQGPADQIFVHPQTGKFQEYLNVGH